jgi:hypothetical protein
MVIRCDNGPEYINEALVSLAIGSITSVQKL